MTRRVTTAIRFPEPVHEALRETADELTVSVNWLVNRAVTDFLAALGDRWSEQLGTTA